MEIARGDQPVPAPCLRQVRGSTGLEPQNPSVKGKWRSPRGRSSHADGTTRGGGTLNRAAGCLRRGAQGAWRRRKGAGWDSHSKKPSSGRPLAREEVLKLSG